MARKELRTLGHILDEIMSMLQIQSTDTVSRERIKGDVVRAYLNEVMPYSSWHWRRKKVNLQAAAYHSTGTASVTQSSTSVTLSTSLTTSRAGQLFSVTGENDSYRIKSHVGGSATLVLENPYTGSTSATATFKIWADSIPLPTDLEEILQLTSPSLHKPLEGVGLNELRRISSANPKGEGRPFFYSLDDWIDPSPYSAVTGLPAVATRTSAGLVRTIRFNATLGATSATALLKVGDRIRLSGAGNYTYNIDAIVSSVTTGTTTLDTITYTALEPLTEAATVDTGITILLANTESYERQKHLLIYPAIHNAKTNLSLDYNAELPPMDDENDEPAMPLVDRIVLYWYGLSYAYARDRNPEEAMIYRGLAERRLSLIAGKTSESMDKPSIVPSRNYLSSKRNMSSYRSRGRFGDLAIGSGSTTNPLGNINTVAVFGSDQTLQSDSLISTTELHALDGISSVSTIEERLDILEGSDTDTAVTLTDNATTTVESWPWATQNVVHIDYSLTRGTSNMESGQLKLITNGTTVAIADGAAAGFGTLGVTFSGDISGTDLRLRATLTSTGTNASMRFTARTWTA